MKRTGASRLNIFKASAAPAEPENVFCAGIVLPELPAGAQAPRRFMFMAAGLQTITPYLNGEPYQITINVEPQSVAAAFNAQLAQHKAAGIKNLFSFDHADSGGASFWPETFHAAVDGVYVEGEWSADGAASVVGKTRRAVSPEFVTDKLIGTPDAPARVTGGGGIIMGSLVTNSAFTRNKTFWAANARQTKPQTQDPVMTKEQLDTLKAQVASLETEFNTFKAAAKAEDAATLHAKQSALQAKQHELALATKDAEIAQLQTTFKAARKEKADNVIQAAIAKGIFPAQPAADSQEKKDMDAWHALIVEDPSKADLLLRASAAPALNTTITGGSQPNVQVGQSDVRTAIKAFAAAAADPVKRGEVYSAGIRNIIAKEDGFIHIHNVFKADNTLGTAYGTLLTQRTLDLLTIQFPLLTRISTNLTSREFSIQDPKLNEAINTRLVTIPAVTKYNAANGYVSAAAVTTDVPVTPDQHAYVQVEFNVNELASTRRLLFGEQQDAMHYAMGKDMVDAIYALFTAANYTEAATDEAKINFSRSTVVDIGTAMQTGSADRNANNGTRTLLLASDYYGQLAKDVTIVGNLVNPSSGQAIASGIIPDVHGFMVVDAPNMPATGNLKGMGLRADAVALASGVPINYANQPGLPSTALQQLITNPNTGFSIQSTMFVDHKAGKTFMRLAWIYGVAKGYAKAGQRVRSAAP